MNVKAKSAFNNKLFALNVVISIPVPDNTAKADIQTTQGEQEARSRFSGHLGFTKLDLTKIKSGQHPDHTRYAASQVDTAPTDSIQRQCQYCDSRLAGHGLSCSLTADADAPLK